jgi:hypothetical protein
MGPGGSKLRSEIGPVFAPSLRRRCILVRGRWTVPRHPFLAVTRSAISGHSVVGCLRRRPFGFLACDDKLADDNVAEAVVGDHDLACIVTILRRVTVDAPSRWLVCAAGRRQARRGSSRSHLRLAQDAVVARWRPTGLGVCVAVAYGASSFRHRRAEVLEQRVGRLLRRWLFYPQSPQCSRVDVAEPG